MIEIPKGILDKVEERLQPIFTRYGMTKEPPDVLPRLYYLRRTDEGTVLFFDMWIDRSRMICGPDLLIVDKDPFVLGGMGFAVKRGGKAVKAVAFEFISQARVSDVERALERIAGGFQVVAEIMCNNAYTDVLLENERLAFNINMINGQMGSILEATSNGSPAVMQPLI